MYDYGTEPIFTHIYSYTLILYTLILYNLYSFHSAKFVIVNSRTMNSFPCEAQNDYDKGNIKTSSTHKKLADSANEKTLKNTKNMIEL